MVKTYTSTCELGRQCNVTIKKILVYLCLSYVCVIATCISCEADSLSSSNKKLGQAEIVVLGPLFSGMYNVHDVQQASELQAKYMQEYGESFGSWPYAAREQLSKQVEQIGNLPDGILFSRIPASSDMCEEMIAEKAWIALLQEYPIVQEEKEWFEESYIITYGTKDMQTLGWWVTYLPFYSFASNLDNESPQPNRTYAVQVDENGTAISVVERIISGDRYEGDESMSPLDVFVSKLFNILHEKNKPWHEMPEDEKLDYNISHMFPHMPGDRTIIGLPDSSHITQENAISIASNYASQIDSFQNVLLDEMILQADFLTGDNTDGRMRSASTYPVWFVSFLDISNNIFFGSLVIAGTTGEIIEVEGFNIP